jgi:hypothetical protein
MRPTRRLVAFVASITDEATERGPYFAAVHESACVKVCGVRRETGKE